jgi:hypothetical protein
MELREQVIYFLKILKVWGDVPFSEQKHVILILFYIWCIQISSVADPGSL